MTERSDPSSVTSLQIIYSWGILNDFTICYHALQPDPAP